MHAIIIFPDFPEVRIEQVQVADEITLTMQTTSPTASCPSCGTLSRRVQSRYARRLHDLPASGRPVTYHKTDKNDYLMAETWHNSMA